MSKIKALFGARVALEMVEEDYEGLIVRAPSPNSVHLLSRVIAVGDTVSLVKPGDIVFWQSNQSIDRFCRYAFNDSFVFVLLETDLIARLSSPVVKLDNFQMLGKWCLARLEQEKKIGRIHLPNAQAQEMPHFYNRYYLQQKGTAAINTIALQERVMVDPNRANPIGIGDGKYAYFTEDFLVGIYDGTEASRTTAA